MKGKETIQPLLVREGEGERGGVASAYMYKHLFLSFGDTSTSAHIQ